MKKSVFILLFSLVGCTDALLEKDPVNDPISNFDILWKEFDEFYSQFSVKQIDWNALRTTYRASITPTTTTNNLASTLKQMLSHLNDNHVMFVNPESSEPVFYAGSLAGQTKDDFYLPLIKSKYLYHSGEVDGITYGKLSEQIGYVHFHEFGSSQQSFRDAVPGILSKLGNTTAMIIDVRDNYGGNDATAQLVAGYFCEEKKLYMKTRRKSGKGHDDFGAEMSWYVHPAGNFNKPIALLTNQWTISSGETFVLAMKTNTRVVHIGDTTAGAFSDSRSFVLPNGFYVKIPQSDVRAANGKSYEGIGLVPAVLATNERRNLLNGTDNVLEEAMKSLK